MSSGVGKYSLAFEKGAVWLYISVGNPSSPAGDKQEFEGYLLAMEFPDLGKHCSEKTCKQLGKDVTE